MGHLDQGELPYSNDSTSLAAAVSVKQRAASLRGQVFDFIEQRGARGATDEEIIDRFGGPTHANGIRPRRVELANARQVIEAGKRLTRSGRQAIVWVARTPEF